MPPDRYATKVTLLSTDIQPKSHFERLICDFGCTWGGRAVERRGEREGHAAARQPHPANRDMKKATDGIGRPKSAKLSAGISPAVTVSPQPWPRIPATARGRAIQPQPQPEAPPYSITYCGRSCSATTAIPSAPSAPAALSSWRASSALTYALAAARAVTQVTPRRIASERR